MATRVKLPECKNLEPWTNPSQEFLFTVWLEEAKDAGIVEWYKDISTDKNEYYQLVDPEVVEYTETKVLYKGTARETTKTTEKAKNLFHGVTYTPDFIVKFNTEYKDKIYTDLNDLETLFREGGSPCYFIANNGGVATVDVKAPLGTGNRNSDGVFSIVRKLMMQRYRIYVNKVMLTPMKRMKNPKSYLFPHTFTPARYLYTDKLTALRTIKKWDVRSLKDFKESL